MQSQIEFYTPKEIAEILKVTTSTIRNMIKRGDLRAVQLKGGRGIYRIPTSELDRMMVDTSTPKEQVSSKSVFASHNFPPEPRQEELLSGYMKGIPTSPVHVTKESKLRDVFFGSDNSRRSKILNKRVHGVFFKCAMHNMTVLEFTQSYGAMDLPKFRRFGSNSVEAVYNAIYTLDD